MKKMTVQFHRPIYVGTSLWGIGSITEKIGERKAIVKAEIFDDQGRLCAASEGEFVLYSKEQFAKLGIIQEEDLEALAAGFEGESNQ